MNIQVCRNTSDAEALYLPQRLFLKPLAKVNITVQLPSTKIIGKAISNWELMERIRSFVQPEIFSVLKVTKTNSDVIRFEAEIEDKRKLDKVISRLDDRSIKLDSYPDSFKLRASEAKLDFPNRHAWDSFFRDAQNMDEMKAGERPDTIYLSHLPIKWFVLEKHQSEDDVKPSENILRKIFEKFGKVNVVDIPMCDPYRKEMKPYMTGISLAPHEQELYFEGYVQFTEYVAFVRAMDMFRGKKLLRKYPDNTAEVIEIKVDFDKTKHMSDATVKRRSIVRERLIARERAKEEKDREEQEKSKKREEHERRKREKSEQEKMVKMVEREERRKAKHLAKLREKEAGEINSKLAHEQKKLLRTQRKLQAIRLVEELFKRIQLKHKFDKNDLRGSRTHSSMHYDNKYELKKLQSALLRDTEQMSSRERLMSKYISAQERELEHQREKISKAMNGKLVLRSALEMKKPKPRTSSISSISSEESFYEASARKIKTEKLAPADDPMVAGQAYPPMMQNYNNYPYPYSNPAYPYQQPPPGGFYPAAPMYPHSVMAKGLGGFMPRGRGFQRRQRGAPYARGAFRGGGKMPYFNGPNANHEYYMYFKRLAEGRDAERDDRSRSRSRRRSYSDSRSRSRSRSRNRHRYHSRSRSKSRGRSRSRSRYARSRSRSRNRRSRSRSRRSRSTNRRSRTRTRSRSYSKSRRSRSRSRHRSHSPSQAGKARQSKEKSAEKPQRSKSREKNGDRKKSGSPANRKESDQSVDNSKNITPREARPRSRSWSLPKDSEKGQRSWSKSPLDENKKNDS